MNTEICASIKCISMGAPYWETHVKCQTLTAHGCKSKGAVVEIEPWC